MRLLFTILSVLFASSLYSQTNFRAMFYNVENLYDTSDNPKKNDEEFTPQGALKWTDARYKKKLKDISRVITAVGESTSLLLIGLCEVENTMVLDGLTKKTSLSSVKYKYVFKDSRDSRSSNVALLYREGVLKSIGGASFRPEIDKENFRTTRDILLASFLVSKRDTLDVFVCHFPSRGEGVAKTKPYRETCARLLLEKVDSLFAIRKNANVIIMGDFNDYPHDHNMYNVLGAKGVTSNNSPKELYNLFYDKKKSLDAGSYKYKGKWNYIDQFVVSGNMLDKKNNIFINVAKEYSAPFMLEDDTKKNGGKRPSKTYSGLRYQGGISDHLPIYMDCILK